MGKQELFDLTCYLGNTSHWILVTIDLLSSIKLDLEQ